MGIWRTLAIIALVAGMSAFGIAASMTSIQMVNAVNRKLPPEAQFSTLMWHTEKTFRLHREYRRLYPNGGLLRRIYGLGAGMFLCWALAAALLFHRI